MERESAWEELGYKPASLPRPTCDPGAFDYLTSYPPRMTRAEGLALARKQLKEIEQHARHSRGSDTGQDVSDKDAA